MILEDIWDFFCTHCGEKFKASPYTNCTCLKCGVGHILCQACWSVHSLSAAQQDHYLASLNV